MISLKHRIQVGNADLSLLLCLTWTRWAWSLWTMLDTSQRRPCFPSEMMVDSHRTDKSVHLFLVQTAFLFWIHPVSEGVDSNDNFWIKAWSYRCVIIIPALYAGGHQIERTWRFFIISSNHLTKFPDEKEPWVAPEHVTFSAGALVPTYMHLLKTLYSHFLKWY